VVDRGGQAQGGPADQSNKLGAPPNLQQHQNMQQQQQQLSMSQQQQQQQNASHYALGGFVNIIHGSDPDVNALALGTDLTSLGLKLNSTDVVYATFAYPSAENPVRREPEYVLPYCYYMKPPALKTSHLTKFTLETLFYIFYTMPKDALQVYAAKELYSRNWRYHKEMKLWFGEPTSDPSNPNLQTFSYFDLKAWKRVTYPPSSGPLQQAHFLREEELKSV
jgi:CCR4-NOT transcription complex subunit 2